MQGVVAFGPAIEDQIFGDLDFFRRDQVQRTDFRYVHDRTGHAGADRVIQKHRVQHGTRGRVQAEADIGQPQNNLDIGERVADHLDPLQRPLAKLAVVFVTGGDGKC